MADDQTITTGGCLCGAVRYRLKGELRDVIACHCTQCRKTSGHFAAMTSVSLDNLELTDERGLAWYHSSDKAERGFCKFCGGNLFWKPAGEHRMSVTGGTLDGPTGLQTAYHIFCADKGDYYEIADGLPQIP